MGHFGIILLILFIIVPFIGVVASRMRELSQQPQRPMAGGDNRRIQEQIEEFLRRASQGRAGPPAAPKGPPPAPAPAEPPDDDQVGTGVGQQVRQYLDTSDFRRRSEAMGGDVVQGDEQFSQQVRKAFSGEVGKLAARRGDTAAPTEVADSDVIEAEIVADEDAAHPTLEALPAAGSGLADVLGSPENIAHAVIMNEILRRPEW